MDTMGERLLALRRKMGITQEDLAEELKVSRQSVSNWELNKTLPDTDKLFALAKIYEVSLDYMVFGIKAEEKEKKEDPAVEDKKSENGKRGGLLSIIQMSGLILCLGVTAVCAVVTIRLISGFATDSERMNSDIAYVDQVIEQYSYVEVSKLDSEGNYAKDRVWLDTRDLSNGDMIFCFTDQENPKKMKFEYYSKTLMLPFGATCLFLLLDGILACSCLQCIKIKRT